MLLLRPKQIHPLTTISHLLKPQLRTLSTLPSNPHIYIHPSPTLAPSYTLSLTPSTPSAKSSKTSLGTSDTNPPTPSTFHANASFSKILQETLAKYAHQDPGLKAQAVAFAAAAGGGALAAAGGIRGGPAHSSQATQARPVGFMHVADERNPPAYGRIPEPEDIFGSLEVLDDGGFVDGTGVYQESGTYRILTREGCLGLSDFLREKLVERLKEIEREE